MDSESESNVSGFIQYNNKNIKKLYVSMNQNLETINQDLQQVERNLKHIVTQSGCLENQLSIILQSLPRPGLSLMQQKMQE